MALSAAAHSARLPNVTSVSISSSGDYIAAVSRDNRIYFFSRDSSAPLWSYTTGGDGNSVAISSDGRYSCWKRRQQCLPLQHRATDRPIWCSWWNGCRGSRRDSGKHPHNKVCKRKTEKIPLDLVLTVILSAAEALLTGGAILPAIRIALGVFFVKRIILGWLGA